MKDTLLRALCCPLCKGRICHERLDADYGVILCVQCKVTYPVIHGVPVMLTYRTKLHEAFVSKFQSLVFPFPRETPPPGELDVQRSFSLEWEGLTEDDLTFRYTNDELIKLHRDAFMGLDEDDYSAEVRSVLDLGCGAGNEANVLSKIFPKANVFAVDINTSILSGPKRYPNVHFVMASVFALPFRQKSIDQVFTQGVIHHTHSTHKAFDALAVLVRAGGHYFCWVYAKDDYSSAPGKLRIIATVYRWFELAARPIISRLPGPLQKAAVYAIALATHHMQKSRVIHRDKWKLKNTVHSTFDTFAPKYAFRHGTNEVWEWFEDRGFACKYQSPRKYRAHFGKRIFGVGINGQLLPHGYPTSKGVGVHHAQPQILSGSRGTAAADSA